MACGNQAGKRWVGLLLLLLMSQTVSWAQEAHEVMMRDFDLGWFNHCGKGWVARESTLNKKEPLKANGQTYRYGISAQAPAGARLQLDGYVTSFTMVVGHDDDIQTTHPIQHQVSIELDGKLAWRSAPLKAGSPLQRVTLPLFGKREMVFRLATDAKPNEIDRVLLGDPRFSYRGVKPKMIQFHQAEKLALHVDSFKPAVKAPTVAGGGPVPDALPADASPPADLSGFGAGAAGGAPSVKIDWGEKIMAGGWTIVALLLLSLVAVALSVERLLALRQQRFAPVRLLECLNERLPMRDYDAVLACCNEEPSTLADAVSLAIEQREHQFEIVSEIVGDSAARDISAAHSAIYPLSVIASLAPLLGLLGTIIGMIEAFELVSIYGDEGGATILAGAIAKALITTAAGLIVAIPCIAVYFILKNRLTRITAQLETALERTIAALYLTNKGADMQKGQSDENPA